MTSSIRFLNQWFSKRLLPWVFIAWVFAYGWLLEQDRYMAFLQPRFRGLVLTGLIISGLFALASVLAKPHERSEKTYCGQWVRGGFLILPILFIAGTHNAGLGGYALSKRSLGTLPPGRSLEEKIQRSDSSLWTMNIHDLPPVEKAEKPVILSRLLRNWSDYEKKQVLTEGIFQAPQDMPEGYAMVFRFYVTCCAADAVPVGIILKGADLKGIKNDQWVRVRGSCHKVLVLGKELPAMTVLEMESLPMPSVAEQYMYF